MYLSHSLLGHHLPVCGRARNSTQPRHVLLPASSAAACRHGAQRSNTKCISWRNTGNSAGHTSWLSSKGHAAGASTAQSATTAAAAVAAVSQESGSSQDAVDTAAEAQRQSLELLEWPAVCRQVAAFCGTSMAAELLLTAQLPMGRTQEESELLLQQTQEAMDAQLDVSGVFDLHPALAAATAGGVLNARQLEGVAASMEAAFRLRASVCEPQAVDITLLQQQQHGQQQHGQQQHGQQQQRQQQQKESRKQEWRWPCLAHLAAAIPERELDTLKAVRSCISDGTVLSEASPELAAVRTARRENREAARALVTQVARRLHAEGAAEGREPLLLRGRYCVAVRTNRRSSMSKGSVKLGASGTGATLYMEPAEVLELNNQEALLAEQEEQQELAVMQALSMLLAKRAPGIQALLESVIALDIVAARAKHAAWLNAVRPSFNNSSYGSSTSSTSSSNGSSSSSSSPIYLPGARHPLLMQAALPPLPRPPSVDDASFESDYIPTPLWASAAGSSSDSDDSDSPSPSTAAPGSQGLRPTPKPLDLRVPADVRVVAITGPNTGGKTVTLKTAGLLVLMAKAGLFVPVDGTELAAAAAAAADSYEHNSNSSSGAGGGDGCHQPTLLWFDQVLADIGDAQSLQQNLSTFSGHIARLKLLLAAAGPGSLVLMDEVGSGTDPQEGAALARAVLDTLAGQARLTLATSHHAELKAAADEDTRYVNVSMEFNTLTLRPTYKLCWGSAGSSNALDIAQALGFDSRVLAEARILARAELGQQQQGKMVQVAASVESQLAATQASLAALVAAREKQEAQVQYVRELIRKVMVQRNDFRRKGKLLEREQAEMVLQVQQAAKGVRRQELELSDVQAIVDWYLTKVSLKTSSSSSSSGSGDGKAEVEDDLAPGDWVYVPEALSGVQLQSVKSRVLKVVGEYVYIDVSPVNTLMMGSSSKASAKGYKVHRSKVFREDLITRLQQQQELEGLNGLDGDQTEQDQQLSCSVHSVLNGSTGSTVSDASGAAADKAAAAGDSR